METAYQKTRAVLVKAVKAGLNVLLEGGHGVGKTALITEVAQEQGLQLKYYSASTLDPFVDLVGLPVPQKDADGHPTLVYHRPRDLHQAAMVFFDELNRAQPKVLNAILEMIQFRTINGEHLPNLRCVCAACNPASEGYDVVELDPALVDRFHVYVNFAPGPDRSWFAAKFGEIVGGCLYDWWAGDLNREQQRQISPRKLEHIGVLLHEEIDPATAMTPLKNVPFELLRRRLAAHESVLDVADFVARPEHFASVVGIDMDTAVRFHHLLPKMKLGEMYKVREITLSLPAEVLAAVQKELPYVIKKTCRAIRENDGAAESDAFLALIVEKTGVT